MHSDQLFLSQFMVFARAVQTTLEAQGYWADYIDPCSGLPVRSIKESRVLQSILCHHLSPDVVVAHPFVLAYSCL